MHKYIVHDYKKLHKRWSWKISFGGAMGGLAGALALSGGAATWAGVIPTWAVFALGGFICAASLIATYIRQKGLGDGHDK